MLSQHTNINYQTLPFTFTLFFTMYMAAAVHHTKASKVAISFMIDDYNDIHTVYSIISIMHIISFSQMSNIPS